MSALRSPSTYCSSAPSPPAIPQQLSRKLKRHQRAAHSFRNDFLNKRQGTDR
jgi:hypothetical protein